MKTKLLGFPINISKGFFDDLKSLLSLTLDQIKNIAKYIKTERGFRLSEESLHNLFKDLQVVPIERLSSILSVGDFIYRLAESKKLTMDDVISDLETLSKELKIEDFGSKKEEFKILFTPNEAFDRERLKTQYKNAVLPNLMSANLVWDIRPVFKTDSTDILTYLSVAVLQMRVEDNATEEETTYAVQLSYSDIKKLVDTLNTGLKEIVAIKKKIAIEQDIDGE